MEPSDHDERPLKPGTVTRLVQQRKNPNRVSVYLDGVFAFGLDKEVVVAHALRRGRALTVAEQEALLAEDGLQRAKARALAYVAYRPRTVHEVRQKLLRTGAHADVAEQVAERLRALGYLDDAAYARSYAEARAAGRGYGPARIRRELMRRGVARSHIEAALAEVLEEEALLAQAQAQAATRWARLAGEADPRKRRKKLFDYLLRRGFTFDTVRQAVDAVAGTS